MGNFDTSTEVIAASQAQLGQAMNPAMEQETIAQAKKDQQAVVRKACAVMRVSSSIVAAIAVHPGTDAGAAELDAATAQLMTQAAQLTDAAFQMVAAVEGAQALAGQKNLLRQQAAEFVSAQWRMSKGAGARELDVGQMVALMGQIMEADPIEAAPESVVHADVTTSKRVALVAALSEIYQAVTGFDYFVPDPVDLVQSGVKSVVRMADAGAARLMHVDAPSDAMAVISPCLIGRLGSLYATHYRAQARKEVMALHSMEVDARMCYLVAHRLTGLPTEHLEASFEQLAQRMVGMVCDAVPELSQTRAAAPTGSGIAQPESAIPA